MRGKSVLSNCAPLANIASPALHVVPQRFLQVGVGTRADQVAFAHAPGDLIGRSIVEFEERGVVLTGHGMGEHHAATQGRMARQISLADGMLVEQEDEATSRRFQRGPPVMAHSLVEGRMVAANIVWRDVRRAREDAPDLRIQPVHRIGVERFRYHGGEGKVKRCFFRLQQDEDRKMPRMRVGPCKQFAKAGLQWLARAALVQVLDVHDLEPRRPMTTGSANGVSAGSPAAATCATTAGRA